MQEYVVNRPDAEAMGQILLENSGNAAGTILRLAWQAGLLRDEIQHLTWAQIDFLDSSIVLPDRSVPISEELAAYLAALREGRRGCPDVVVLSDRDKKPLAPPSISRLARQDIARILKIEAGQCRPILKKMIAAGQISQQRQRYTLKKEA